MTQRAVRRLATGSFGGPWTKTKRVLATALGLLLLGHLHSGGAVALTGGSATHPARKAPADPIPERLLYVCVQDDASIAVVDMETLEVRTIVQFQEFGFGPQAAPHDIAVDSDGLHWYVSLVGEHQVLKFDEENRLVASVGMETPGMLGLDPAGETLLMSRSMSATDPPRLVGLTETAEMSLSELDVVFPRPHAIAIGRDGRFAYTASLSTNQLASIELATQRVELVNVPGAPHAFVQFAISPDGGTLVASGELSGELVVFDLEDPSRPEFVTSLILGSRPFDPTFAPDGGTVWIPMKSTSEVAIVETAYWTMQDRIVGEGLRQPHAIEFSPDGRRAFVSNNAAPPFGVSGGGSDTIDVAQLVVIDTESREIEATLGLGRNLTGMGHRSIR